MSDININDFFSLDGKVALVTGGMPLLLNRLHDLLAKNVDQAQEVSVSTQRLRLSSPVPKRSSLSPENQAVNRALIKLSNDSTASPQQKGYAGGQSASRAM